MNGVGVKLIAAYLGLSEGRVRAIIAQHNVQSVGVMWKAKMYDPQEVIRHAVNHRTRKHRNMSDRGHTLTPSDRMP